jgi:flagellar protein FliS
MIATTPNTYYRESQITTSGPGQLLLLVYDGTLRCLGEARRAMRAQQIEEQNSCLTKAQALLMELMQTLDHSAFPELAANLERLYSYMFDRLVYANVHDDERAITDVATLLADLREAWYQADLTVRAGQGMPVAGRRP